MSELPKGHIATNPYEIARHGHHADLIADTSFGSHQIRVGQDGHIIDQQLNFRGGGIVPLNALGLPDPRYPF